MGLSFPILWFRLWAVCLDITPGIGMVFGQPSCSKASRIANCFSANRENFRQITLLYLSIFDPRSQLGLSSGVIESRRLLMASADSRTNTEPSPSKRFVRPCGSRGRAIASAFPVLQSSKTALQAAVGPGPFLHKLYIRSYKLI